MLRASHAVLLHVFFLCLFVWLFVYFFLACPVLQFGFGYYDLQCFFFFGMLNCSLSKVHLVSWG